MNKSNSSIQQFSNRQDDRKFFEQHPEVFFLFILLIVVLCLGMFGYSFIEGWGLFDSLYMTVITLAAVGFQEVHPLSNIGRFFTIILIFIGFGLVTAFFTTITQVVLERQLRWALKGRNRVDELRKITGHTIICGYGRLARIAAAELKQQKVDVVIVDIDPTCIEEARSEGFLAVEGDATIDETLKEAGILRAARLVSLLSKGSDNLYVVMTSRELCSSLFIMSRAEDEVFEKRLKRAGVTRLISPYRVGGKRIADGIVRPFVTNFLDLASSSSTSLQIEELTIPANSSLVGKTLKSSGLRKHCNVIVVGIIPPSLEMIFNPNADTVIEAGATFIVVGEGEELVKLENRLIADDFKN
jgi:voltage-gated potassium channel